MSSLLRNFFLFLLGLLVIAGVLSTLQFEKKEIKELDLGTFIARVKAQEVSRVVIKGDELEIELKDGTKATARKEAGESFSTLLSNYGVEPAALEGVATEIKSEGGFSYWFTALLPFLIPFLLIGTIIFFMMRQVQGANSRAMSFGQAGAREVALDAKTKVTFKDVASLTEAKEELKEIVEFLRNPKRFTDLGAKIPKGVLLMGAPGSGKTLLARAIAGEAKVPFFHISGSEFVEMFVGVGASVTGDTPVLIRKKGDNPRLLPISEVVDQYYQKGESGRVIKIYDLETLGFEAAHSNFWGARGNSGTKYFSQSAWKNVSGVFRHYAEEIFEIHYLGGVLKTTGDHSVFVRHRNLIKAKRADELKMGDILVNLPFKVRGKFIPSIGTTHTIKAHAFNENCAIPILQVSNNIADDVDMYESAMAVALSVPAREVAEMFGVHKETILLWRRGQSSPRGFTTAKMSASLPREVVATETLCKLLGFYTAEGRDNSNLQFVFGKHENDLHKECIDGMCETFGVEPALELTEDNTLRITYYSSPLGKFFASHCGNGSKNKHIPPFLWSLPKSYFLAYLEGFTKGDGYTTTDGKLSACSISYQLIRELAWLSSMHGIGVGIRETISPAGRVIKDKDKPLPETKAWNLIIGKSSHPFREYDRTTAWIKKPVVKKIIKKSYNGYVYDLCGVENEAFFGGEKPTLLHNSRVRSLFQKAKKSAPCIIFIDEIDAVGRQRGAGLGGGHDEREQTLNQILVEMDGFDPNIGVIVCAATNRPDILDQALLRPGRFDRRVILDLPDMKGREEILKLHAKGKPLNKDANLKVIAQRTPGFSGADLANLINEATILTVRRDKKEVGWSELIESIEKVMLGPERKSHMLTKKEREITAYHEGGHALVGHELPGADPIRKISIISRGRAAGYTLKLPTEDKHLKNRAEFLDEVATLLGGYVAEKEVFGDITTGASNDLRMATQLTRRLVTEYGMSDKLGPRTFGEREEMIFLGREIHEQRDYSEETARNIDAEIDKIISDGQVAAHKIVKDKRVILDTIAKRLLEKETIEQEEFESLFQSGNKVKLKKEKGVAVPQLGAVVV